MGLLSLSKLRDHPRMCGEHAVPAVLPVSTPGSSPHVRGALAVRQWLTLS